MTRRGKGTEAPGRRGGAGPAERIRERGKAPRRDRQRRASEMLSSTVSGSGCAAGAQSAGAAASGGHSARRWTVPSGSAQPMEHPQIVRNRVCRRGCSIREQCPRRLRPPVSCLRAAGHRPAAARDCPQRFEHCRRLSGRIPPFLPLSSCKSCGGSRQPSRTPS